MDGGGGHGGGHGGGDGLGGGGRESPPVAKLIQCDEEGVISISPILSARLVGLMPLLLGLCALCYSIACVTVPDRSGQVTLDGRVLGAAFFLLPGLLFTFVGYYVLSPATMHLDGRTRTYTKCKGWWPLRRVTEGSWEEFQRLSLKTWYEVGKSKTLYLHWSDTSRSPVALHTSNREEAEHYRRAVARLLELPSDAPLSEGALSAVQCVKTEPGRRV